MSPAIPVPGMDRAVVSDETTLGPVLSVSGSGKMTRTADTVSAGRAGQRTRRAYYAQRRNWGTYDVLTQSSTNHKREPTYCRLSNLGDFVLKSTRRRKETWDGFWMSSWSMFSNIYFTSATGSRSSCMNGS
jgi:hypothetical protein